MKGLFKWLDEREKQMARILVADDEELARSAPFAFPFHQAI